MNITAPPPIDGHVVDPRDPLTQFVIRRMLQDRDVKIIITAKDGQTGTGKTTLAGWFGLQWTPMFTGEPWEAATHATLNVSDYFDQYRSLPPGSVLVMDEAEQLDARRHMTSENVDFSHEWMMMRVRQVISILTLPTPKALDSRLEELADVWINVERRGRAQVHYLSVQSYGSRNTQTPKEHRISWPDVGDHPELQDLHQQKEEMLDRKMESREQPDPDEIKKTLKQETAQRLREVGVDTKAIAEGIDMSRSWVYKNTDNPDTTDSRQNRMEAEA